MIRMLGAELLKLRRRWATFVVLAVLIGLMALVYLLVGTVGRGPGSGGGISGGNGILRFPNAFTAIDQFVFGLGSLLAITYAAAIGGADWTWGIVRVVVARGESRSGYIAIKALAIGIVLLIGVLVAYLAGILLTLMAAAMIGVNTGNPVAGASLGTLLRAVGYGYLVVLERAAIGFGVAVLLRSQLAGIVAGIVLYIGEAILTVLLIGLTLRDRLAIGSVETQWFQFLPFSIGNSVLSSAGNPNDIGSALLQPVPLGTALAVTVGYLVAAIVIAAVSVERAEINS
jgi:ABC-type transport system involved in multi-copper enzyme maturation permease subunit